MILMQYLTKLKCFQLLLLITNVISKHHKKTSGVKQVQNMQRKSCFQNKSYLVIHGGFLLSKKCFRILAYDVLYQVESTDLVNNY